MSLYNFKKVEFEFKQAIDNFKVIENNDFKFVKKGDFKLIKVTKRGVSTIELIEYLSEVFKINKKNIGYAGLKDKNATTIQYLTLPKNLNVKKFNNSNRVSLQELGIVKEPLKIGNLKSNSFEIKIKLNEQNYKLLQNALNEIKLQGMPNFFGEQRFGKISDSIKKGKKINLFGKGGKNQRSLIVLGSYQAYYFNLWLKKRIEISKLIDSGKNILNLSPTLFKFLQEQNLIFKLLPGDILILRKKNKKIYETAYNLQDAFYKFNKKIALPSGVLFGNSVIFAKSVAGKIEREFIDREFSALKGTRREAWIFIKDLSCTFKNNTAILKFTLPPGSYATVLLEQLKKNSF